MIVNSNKKDFNNSNSDYIPGSSSNHEIWGHKQDM